MEKQCGRGTVCEVEWVKKKKTRKLGKKIITSVQAEALHNEHASTCCSSHMATRSFTWIPDRRSIAVPVI